ELVHPSGANASAARKVRLRRAVATDLADVDANDFRRVLGFGGIEIAAVHAERALGAIRDVERHGFLLRAADTVFGFPRCVVADRTGAAGFLATCGIQAECDAEFILADAHDQRILRQGHAAGAFGGEGTGARERRECKGQTQQLLREHDYFLLSLWKKFETWFVRCAAFLPASAPRARRFSNLLQSRLPLITRKRVKTAHA